MGGFCGLTLCVIKIWHIEEIHQKYCMHSCVHGWSMHIAVCVHVYMWPACLVLSARCLKSCEFADKSHGYIIQDLAVTTAHRVKVILE